MAIDRLRKIAEEPAFERIADRAEPRKMSGDRRDDWRDDRKWAADRVEPRK
jgi:hypothetical protein